VPEGVQIDPKTRTLDGAIALLESGGPQAVQARKLGAEIGASTMAVYTYFGGMAELFEAMTREGFVRLADHIAAVALSEDPIMDFFTQGLAYRDWALANPQLYRLMFGMAADSIPRRVAQDMTLSGTISSFPEGQAAFDVMTGSLERIKASGRIDQTDTIAAAGQFLAATHGFVLLEMAGYFGPEGDGLTRVVAPMAISLMVGLGAKRDNVERSIRGISERP
jgi:AcrR family transcriptional regulator